MTRYCYFSAACINRVGRLESRPNQNLITLCHRLGFLDSPRQPCGGVSRVLGGLGEAEDPQLLFTFSSETVDFISCRPRPATLLSAFFFSFLPLVFYFFTFPPYVRLSPFFCRFRVPSFLPFFKISDPPDLPKSLLNRTGRIPRLQMH